MRCHLPITALILGLLHGIGLGLWPVPAIAAQAHDVSEVSPPTEIVPRENCVTSECHVSIKARASVHGPVNVDACDACHELTDPATHTFEPARDQARQCTFCHEPEQMQQAPVVHQPVLDRECTACHDPHGGADRRLLKDASLSTLCADCHRDVTRGEHVHGPAAAGVCSACHGAHGGEHEGLLSTTGRDLCLSCHTEIGEQLETMTFRHEPVEDDCAACHDPHASDHSMMVKQAPATLCTDGCHSDTRELVNTAEYQHSAVIEADGCAHCHNPHGGHRERFMRQTPIDLCMSCHDQPRQTERGHTVPAMTNLTDEGQVRHGPVREGTCGGCHEVHGSNTSRLLTQPFSEKFYESFQLDKYALCFNCHDEELAQQEQTRTLTNFRDGATNLHFIHVNKDERGRSCRACHEAHSSPNAYIVSNTVPYGEWQLPINYTPTKTGGTCAPGCHQELSYTRTTGADDHENVPANE